MKNIVASLPVSLQSSEIFFKSSLFAPAPVSDRARLQNTITEMSLTYLYKYVTFICEYSSIAVKYTFLKESLSSKKTRALSDTLEYAERMNSIVL